MSKTNNSQSGNHSHLPATTAKDALEKARECPDCASDSRVIALLEATIDIIWKKIQASQDYVMSRDEFAFFNYFQYRFEGSQTAKDARKRYWDSI